jgi:hypothetical protein
MAGSEGTSKLKKGNELSKVSFYPSQRTLYSQLDIHSHRLYKPAIRPQVSFCNTL